MLNWRQARVLLGLALMIAYTIWLAKAETAWMMLIFFEVLYSISAALKSWLLIFVVLKYFSIYFGVRIDLDVTASLF